MAWALAHTVSAYAEDLSADLAGACLHRTEKVIYVEVVSS